MNMNINNNEKKVSKLAIASFILSFFFGAIAFVLAIFAIQEINRTDSKGKGLAGGAILISVVNLILLMLLILNYNTVANKISEEIKKRTTTVVYTEIFTDTTGSNKTTTSRTTTTAKVPKNTTTRPKVIDYKKDRQCLEAYQMGMCKEDNVDGNGDALCYYYKEKATTSYMYEYPYEEVEIRCPYYYYANDWWTETFNYTGTTKAITTKVTTTKKAN